jgi:hypothetical protein
MLWARGCAYAASVAKRHVDGDWFIAGYSENGFYGAFSGDVAFAAVNTL